ncbi:MAG TPA: TolC family protein [Bacteroidales bacterium]|nr:TolC family protein [Bacteroidales bacterium]HPI31259.1 TolC family protein [Bacteroidales bacterium]HQN16903.1 TolC family protein [Bacteroidales bacterium]HQP16565.1 TolC family protein [Bacteroidales bacterium]
MNEKILQKIVVLLLLCFCRVYPVTPQSTAMEGFTLQEAMDYAVTNSYKVRAASIDLQSTIARRKGYLSLGMPQINANASYQYYFNLPVQLMPNILTPAVDGALVQHGLITPDQMMPVSDEKLPVQFGSTNNLTVGVSATQVVFDGTYLVGLKAASMLVELSKASIDKSIREIKSAVAQAYYLVLIAKENRRILDSTYTKMNVILDQTRQFQTSGFIEDTDVEQLSLMVSNLKNKMDMTDRNIDLAVDLLQLQMGMDIDQEIVLKDDLMTLLNQAISYNIADKQFDVNDHIDFQLLKNQERLLNQVIKVDESAYYPTMALFFNTQSAAMREKFDFFDDSKWYNTTLVGVNLSIPIWSSGGRHYKVMQDKYALEKHRITLKEAEDGLKIDINNSKSLLKTYSDQFYTDKKNYDLAVTIYDKTYSKFKEGLASGMDLNQAYLQILSQHGTYLNTMLQLLNTYANLSKALSTF